MEKIKVVSSVLGANPSNELFSKIVESLKYDNKRTRRGTPFFLLECMAGDEYEMFNPVLHLGHTLGHQIEFHSNFQLTHGEALSLGIRAEASLSKDL